ncbi:MAG: START domain-containing protein [Chitinophagales bacterium]
MKHLSRTLIIFLAFTSLSSFRKQQQVNEWVYEREKKGIKVFTKKSKWGRLRDSKAVMLVSASPEEMLRLLTDFDNYPSWVPRCKKANVVARLSDNEFIAHIVFNAPWPVADRDCVLKVKIERDTKTGTITMTETSEPKYLKPEDGTIRVEQLVAKWKFTPKADGTEVTNEYSSNPGGSIPDWMTNTESVTNPLSTFENLQTKVADSKTSHQ